jgi:hypothetical protein
MTLPTKKTINDIKIVQPKQKGASGLTPEQIIKIATDREMSKFVFEKEKG